MPAPNRHRLNDLYIGRLRPRPRQYLVWDTVQYGLAIQVQPKTGTKAFYCIYTFGGRSRWYHIANVAAIELTEARRLAGKIMVQVAEGKDPAAERKADRGSGTFEELAKRYRAYAMKKNKSWQQADALVTRFLLPKWSKLRTADIVRSDVKALMSGITAPIVANQTLAAASAIFGWGVREELVKVNPCVGIERNKTASRERVLSDSELPKFWSAFDDGGLIASMALKMILITGQRPGEVLHMRTEHIADGWWTLPGDPVPALGWPGTKNAATHRVWLAKPAQDILAEMDSTGFVFTSSPGKNKPTGHLDEVMRGICKSLGVDRATPHDLRRTFSTTVTSLGFGKDAMNRVTNHKEGGIATVYDRHAYSLENRKIMETVANRIMTLVEGGSDSNVIALGAR